MEKIVLVEDEMKTLILKYDDETLYIYDMNDPYFYFKTTEQIDLD